MYDSIKIKSNALVKKIKKACFPNYRGRKLKLSTNIPKSLNSYWDGGSKEEYCFYEVATGRALPVSTNHPFFEADNPRHLSQLPLGVILVNHTYFCGHDLGLTFYVNEDDLQKQLTC